MVTSSLIPRGPIEKEVCRRDLRSGSLTQRGSRVRRVSHRRRLVGRTVQPSKSTGPCSVGLPLLPQSRRRRQRRTASQSPMALNGKPKLLRQLRGRSGTGEDVLDRGDDTAPCGCPSVIQFQDSSFGEGDDGRRGQYFRT